jgi:hypothetical protein
MHLHFEHIVLTHKSQKQSSCNIYMDIMQVNPPMPMQCVNMGKVRNTEMLRNMKACCKRPWLIQDPCCRLIQDPCCILVASLLQASLANPGSLLQANPGSLLHPCCKLVASILGQSRIQLPSGCPQIHQALQVQAQPRLRRV